MNERDSNVEAMNMGARMFADGLVRMVSLGFVRTWFAYRYALKLGTKSNRRC